MTTLIQIQVHKHNYLNHDFLVYTYERLRNGSLLESTCSLDKASSHY